MDRDQRQSEGKGEGRSVPLRRRDAQRNRARILRAAAIAFQRDPSATLEQVAAAAGVGRSTLHRHFSTREDLTAAVARHTAPGLGALPAPGDRRAGGVVVAAPADAAELAGPSIGELRPPGRLGNEEPLVIDATNVLNEVPPHLVGEQLVAEAERLAGVPVALFMIDVDGTHLLRLVGSDAFPAAVGGPLAVGPEIAPDALPVLYDRLEELLPDSVPYPMWVRGRAIGVLLALTRPRETLAEIARQGTAALELANLYTDAYEVARRRRETSPAAELQLNLLPPRNARVAGAELAGSLLPSYEIAGDWFDYVENADGAWLAIADPTGSGPIQTALGSIGLGALRAARRSGADLEATVAAMNQAVASVDGGRSPTTAIVARWHATSSTLRWVNLSHRHPALVRTDGRLVELATDPEPPLGRMGPGDSVQVHERRIEADERVVLYTDGVVERRGTNGARFGLEGLEAALRKADDVSAAAAARSIQNAILGASPEAIEDDSALVVLATSE